MASELIDFDTRSRLIDLRRSLLLLARLIRVGSELDMLTKRQAPPTSTHYLHHLPEEKISCKGVECPICLKKFRRGSKAKVLPCKHYFHLICIRPWLEKTNSCPLCRFELPTDDEEYENLRRTKRAKYDLEGELDRLYQSFNSSSQA